MAEIADSLSCFLLAQAIGMPADLLPVNLKTVKVGGDKGL